MFGPLGIILATIGAVKDSGGRRSVNMITIAVFIYFEYLGLISYSKQVMLTPMVCWAVGVFYARLRVRFVHVVAVVADGRLKLWLHLAAFRVARSGVKEWMMTQHLDARLVPSLEPIGRILHEHIKQIEVDARDRA